MSDKKGFTLIELIVSLIILGILVAITVPSYNTMVMQGSTQTAQNNLITIYNAEKNFYYSNGYYCTRSTQNLSCASSLANINNALSLNIQDSYFTYSCNDPNSSSDGNNGSDFSCTATSNSIANLYLTLSNKPIIL